MAIVTLEQHEADMAELRQQIASVQTLARQALDLASNHGAGHLGGQDFAGFGFHTYVFLPDAAPATSIVTGDGQGIHHHSGPKDELVYAVVTDFETVPTGAAILYDLEYGDTNDLDTASVWTRIIQQSHSISAKTIITLANSSPASFTSLTIPANRLIRGSIDQIGSTIPGQDGAAHLMVLRPLERGI